jgi:pimeloyl-ACP methyl ester carboxylesterase
MSDASPAGPRTTVVLIHSPLVGPFTWQPVATVLRNRGYKVVVPALSLAKGPPFFANLAAQATSELRAEPAESALYVAHSGAGAIIPAAIEAGHADAAVLFVDAVLPQPGMSWLENAPALLREHLIKQCREGLLPRWCDWFPRETLISLLPDQILRERFIDELSLLPVGYFEEREPRSSRWPVARCGYLQLSAAYEAETQSARSRGWIVRSKDSNHLAMITDPNSVAAAIISMLNEIRGLGASGGS